MTDFTVDGRRASAFASIALGGMLAWSGSVSAQPQTLPGPTATLPWAGCTLSDATLAELAGDIQSSSKNKIDDADVVVDAVIVLRLDASNWGQAIKGSSDFTARILCAAEDVMVAEDTEEARFPDDGEVDILNADETLAIRALGLSGSEISGQNAARICLTSNTTAESTDLESDPVTCFRLVLDAAP